MANGTWLGFKHISGMTYVCQLENLLEVVNVNDAIQILVTGLDGYKVANVMAQMGHKPEMRYVHAHVAGKSRVGRPAKPVVCNETGKIYASINEAARATFSTVGNLSNHLRFPNAFKTVKGHTFSYYKGV